MTATKATRFKEARLLACNHNLTIGQALTLLTGGNVSGNRLSDYEEQESGTDAPYATVGMMHYSL